MDFLTQCKNKNVLHSTISTSYAIINDYKTKRTIVVVSLKTYIHENEFQIGVIILDEENCSKTLFVKCNDSWY